MSNKFVCTENPCSMCSTASSRTIPYEYLIPKPLRWPDVWFAFLCHTEFDFLLPTCTVCTVRGACVSEDFSPVGFIFSNSKVKGRSFVTVHHGTPEISIQEKQSDDVSAFVQYSMHWCWKMDAIRISSQNCTQQVDVETILVVGHDVDTKFSTVGRSTDSRDCRS